jgi:mono/diheme cytochrome c family protein
MSHKNLNWLFLLTSLLGVGTPAQAAPPQTSQAAAALYKEECASCHMAYPPQLLPVRSWKTILRSLEHHFGDNATLDPATLQTLSQYLQDHSADAAGTSRKILRSLASDSTPLRISELPSIRRHHREIPARLITGNPQVKSQSNCIACHQGAEQGAFDEHQVRIPGYGRWDD